MKRRKKRSCHSSSSSDEDDSDFDLKDEAFTYSPSPSPSPSPPPKKSQPKNGNPIQTRKKLALPKAPRSDRKKRKAETAMSVKRDEVDVFDSEDDGLPCTKIPTFDMLLEAASFHTDGGHPTQMNNPSSRANVDIHAKQETKFGECTSEKETDSNLMSEDEENNKGVDYCVDDSDGLEKENKMDFMVLHAKKTSSRLASQQTSPISYSTNSTKPTITIHDKNKALEISIDESQLAGHIKENHKEPSEPVVSKSKTCGKLGTPVSSKITRKFRTEAAGVRRVPLRLPGTGTSLKSNTEPSSENNTSASSCSKVLQIQSSSAPHQRVIGLSRRVRPPPLHPYLSKTDK